MSVILELQIAAVARELALRRRVYPRQVAVGRMKQADADREIDAMRAVHDTLRGLAGRVGDELNPGHPVTISLRDQWHKVLAVLMRKTAVEHFVISGEDIDLIGDGYCVVGHHKADGLHIYIVDAATARELAKTGGVPS